MITDDADREQALRGIGVIMNAWDVYGRQEITEDDIQREMHHLSK